MSQSSDRSRSSDRFWSSDKCGRQCRPHPLSYGLSAAGVTRSSAAGLDFRFPDALLTLHNVERLDGVAVIVKSDRAAKTLETHKLGHVVADLAAVDLEVFG